jgi:hypothetical protein
MQHIRKLLWALPLVLAACTKDFEEINRNPNATETISPEFLLSNVLISTAYDYQKDAYWDKPASAGRYITMVRNEGNDKFDWGPQSWDGHYSRLSTNKNMMDLAEASGQQAYIAVGKVLKAFNFAYVSDLYGDVPYSEALLSKDEGIVHPKYDAQQEIYPSLIKELEDANTLLTNAAEPVSGNADVMYEGDALKWRKFANSLRLRLLLRMSKNYPQAFTAMQQIVSDKNKYPIFVSNADNAEVRYLGDIGANSWPGGPLANAYSEFDKRKPSKEIVDALLKRKDPRLPVWVAPVEEMDGALVDHNEYVGVPNAVPAPYDYNGGNTHISRLSTLFNADVDDMLKASMMTYAELCFILAECVQAGKITVPGKTAESLYYDGIAANMKYYGVDGQATEEHYYDQPLVKYDGTKEQLIVQKWIALFLKGAEGWFDHRRTGFPRFVLGPAAAQKTIPSRYIYPDTERAYNEERYQEALNRFGEDKQNTLMWYLK